MLTSWHPVQLLRSDTRPVRPYAVIILNQPINTNVYAVVSKRASLIVLADGAGNHFYDQYLRPNTDGAATGSISEDALRVRLPDAVVGDLDSLQHDISQALSTQGIQIHKDPDQYCTELEKCLKWIWTRLDSSSSSPQAAGTDTITKTDIIIMGSLAGRVDHAMSNLHQMYVFSKQPQEHDRLQHHDSGDDDHRRPQSSESRGTGLCSRYYFLSDQALTFVLELGQNQIHFPLESVLTTRSTKDVSNPEPAYHGNAATNVEKTAIFTENIGILPLAGPCSISTNGLEWDVHSWPTKFGIGAMSTSNHIRSHTVEIEVSPMDGPEIGTLEPQRDRDDMMGPLFTVELAKRFCG